MKPQVVHTSDAVARAEDHVDVVVSGVGLRQTEGMYVAPTRGEQDTRPGWHRVCTAQSEGATHISYMAGRRPWRRVRRCDWPRWRTCTAPGAHRESSSDSSARFQRPRTSSRSVVI